MEIMRRKFKSKPEIIYVDGEIVKWLTLERLPTSVYQVRYQLLGKNEVRTEYYSTVLAKRSRSGAREVVTLIQKVEQPDADWIWKRQIKRGVIV